ncbi:MAG: VCBS repeat-containing protein, partial [Bacteroidota bacterium]
MKRFTQFFILLFLPLVLHISALDYEAETCPRPAPLKAQAPQATVHGVSKASFKVDEAGNATYSIPIVMSPGVNDLQPNLSLSYSSSGGTSMLGFGWSLSGVPSITRAPNTIAQDCTDPNNINCTSRAVKLTNSDQLAIAGERLKRISGSQFGNNSVYRTEQETWQRVTYYTSEGGYFIVNTPDGLKMTFGRGINNRTRAAGTSTTLTWWLNRVEDQFGNYYTITYENFSTPRSEVVPKEINYTGNSSQKLAPFAKVRFNYENHPYPRKTWIAGRLILQQRRLKSIETLIDNQLVRRYNMTYQVRSRSRNSYLTKVQECNSSNQCFEPITFQWGGNSDEDGIDLNNVQLIPNAGVNFDKPKRDDRKYFFIPSDYTGDGRSDMIHVYKENRFKFWRSNGNGTFHVGGEVSLPTSIDRDNWTILPGEFNGDHRMDIMYIPVSQSKRVRIGRSNGNGTFNFYEWYAGSSFGGDLEHDEVRTGDFNGDGLTDIINFSGDDIFVMLKTRTTLHSSANAFTVRKTTPNYPPGDKPSEDADRVIIADFNGDGWDDIWHTPERHRLYVMLSKGDGTFAPPITHNYNNYDFKQPDKDYASYQFIPGDYNGDGLTDLVHISDDQYLKIFTSTGNGYFNISGQVTSNVDRDLLKANSQWRAGDFNGDGLTDLIHITNDRGVHFWYAEPKSNGDAGFNVRHNNYPDSGNRFRGCTDDNGFLQESDGNTAFFFVLDFTGNGRTDLVHFSDDECSYAWSSDTDASHKIVGFQNGPSVNKIDVEYKYITDPAVYKGSKTYSYPKVRATGGLCVAYKSKIPNGIGNHSKNETRYEYYDAFFNVHGRGFRGFEKVITYEYGRDYKHTVIYDRDDKCLFARVKQMDRHLISNNKLLERTRNRIIIRESVPGKKVYWSEFDQVEKWNYDLSSTSRASYMRTNYAFDSYANATRVEERHYGKSSTLLNYLKRDYKFYNNSSTWLLGKQTEEKTYNSYRSQSGNTLTTKYHWDSQYKYIHREEREPGGPNELRLTTNYSYDGYGNKIWERLFGWNGKAHVSRSSKWRYRSTERFRFPYQIENAKGHIRSFTYDKKHGRTTQITDPNGIWQKISFDAFGRDIQSQQKGEGIVYKSRHFNLSSATQFSEVRINGRNSGEPSGSNFFDILGRRTKSYTVMYESNSEKRSYIDRVYNSDGTLWRESNPYFQGQTKYFTTYAYDKLDRQISMTEPSNTGQSRVSRVSFSLTNTGLLAINTNPLKQKTYVYTDATGRNEKIRDNLNGWIYFYYNGAGL